MKNIIQEIKNKEKNMNNKYSELLNDKNIKE